MSRSAQPLLRVLSAGVLATGLLSTVSVAEAAPGKEASVKSEVPRLTVYRRARCEKENFGPQDACDTLVRWLDSWHIRYDLKDVSRYPNYGLTLNQRCLMKHISCSEPPVVDDGKTILTGRALGREMMRWAMLVDPSRVESEKAAKKDVVPEILVKDEPAVPIEAPKQETRRPPKMIEEE